MEVILGFLKMFNVCLEQWFSTGVCVSYTYPHLS